MLRPAHLDLSLIGRPLPWDLFTESGVLVAGRGMLIADESHFLRLAGRPLYLKSEPGPNIGVFPERFLELASLAESLLSAPASALDVVSLAAVAGDLSTLYQVDPDASLGLTRHVARVRPGVAHSLHVLFVAQLLADQLEMNEAERDSLAAAALTMNMADPELQDRLVDQPLLLSAEERRQLRDHPAKAAAMLAEAGLRDGAWLDCVAQHHENMDGSGYPAGIQGADIRLGARILRVADTYCTKVGSRDYRPPRSARAAVQEIFGRDRGRLDSQLAILLLRRLGVFPPGTLVRLASRETACITRRSRAGALRFAVSFLDARGRPMDPPRERDLGTRTHQLRGVLDADPAWPPIDWKQLWGY